MLFFTFIKGGGITPLTGPPNLNGFSSIIRGGVISLLTNVNKKMVFLMKASLIHLYCLDWFLILAGWRILTAIE